MQFLRAVLGVVIVPPTGPALICGDSIEFKGIGPLHFINVIQVGGDVKIFLGGRGKHHEQVAIGGKIASSVLWRGEFVLLVTDFEIVNKTIE